MFGSGYAAQCTFDGTGGQVQRKPNLAGATPGGFAISTACGKCLPKAVRRLYTITPFEFYDTHMRPRTQTNGCQPRAVLGERVIGVLSGKAGPGRGKKTVGNANRLSAGGMTRAYILARLDRDRPELATQVRLKKITANQAAILAGFRRNPAALQKILKLLPRLTSTERNTLQRKL